MIHLKHVLSAVCALGCALAMAPAAHADSLSVDRSSTATSNAMPQRGLSMARVESRFGAPVSKLPSAGGDTAKHPQINRWQYPGYTVYFERNHVIHSVRDGA